MNKYLFLLTSSLILCGCSAAPISAVQTGSPSASPQISSDKHRTIDDISLSETPLTDFENQSAANTNDGSIVPSGSGDGLLKLGTAVRYCDPDVADQFAYYCFEPGCKHTDPTCHSYIGNAQSFIAYEGIWYYTRQNDSDQFEIVCHNPVTNERKVIAQYERSDDGHIWEVIGSMIVSHGLLYVSIQRFETAEDTMQQTSSSYIDTIDLQTFERKRLENCNDHDGFICGNGEKAVIVHTEPRTAVNDSEYVYSELDILDLTSGQRVKITDTDQGYYNFSDPYQLSNQDKLVYIESNNIHLLDLGTMENQVIYSSQNTLSRAWFFGNHVRFLEKEKDGSYLVESMIDLDGNNRQDYPELIDNEENVIKFGYQYLTEHGQIGTVMQGNNLISGWISEENYLRCDLNQIVSAKA